jgi:hypothetical protein
MFVEFEVVMMAMLNLAGLLVTLPPELLTVT